MPLWRTLFATLGVGLLLGGCPGEPTVAPSAPPPTLAAEPALLPLANALLSVAGLETRALPVETGRAIADVLRGNLDGVVTHRGPSDSEQRLAAGRDLVADEALETRLLAQEDLFLVVGADSPITELTVSDAADLLAGGRDLWDGLGTEGPVTLLVPPRASGAWSILADALDGLEGPPAAASWQATDSSSVRQVRALPGALAVISSVAAVGVRPLALRDGERVMLPGTRDWPLRRDLLLVTRGAPGRLTPLVEAASSQAGRSAVEALSYLSAEPP